MFGICKFSGRACLCMLLRAISVGSVSHEVRDPKSPKSTCPHKDDMKVYVDNKHPFSSDEDNFWMSDDAQNRLKKAIKESACFVASDEKIFVEDKRWTALITALQSNLEGIFKWEKDVYYFLYGWDAMKGEGGCNLGILKLLCPLNNQQTNFNVATPRNLKDAGLNIAKVMKKQMARVYLEKYKQVTGVGFGVKNSGVTEWQNTIGKDWAYTEGSSMFMLENQDGTVEGEYVSVVACSDSSPAKNVDCDCGPVKGLSGKWFMLRGVESDKCACPANHVMKAQKCKKQQ